jgi:hypothetical protein
MYGVDGRLDLLNRWLLLEFADDRGRGTTFETRRGWGRVIKVHRSTMCGQLVRAGRRGDNHYVYYRRKKRKRLPVGRSDRFQNNAES